MATLPSNIGTLQKILQEADAQLRDIEYSPFSSQAFSKLKEEIGKYIIQLISESIRISRHHQADIVSATHVEQASDRLVSSTGGRFFRHLGTIGGILLGASLSNMLSMTVIAQYSILSTLVSASLGIIGSFMIALHIAKD